MLQTEKACVTRAMNNECNRDCYNCDLCEDGKDILAGYDAVIHAIEENQQYRAIGTAEEFKGLKEKNTPKKPIRKPDINGKYEEVTCPSCNSFIDDYTNKKYCNCGQALNWQL